MPASLELIQTILAEWNNTAKNVTENVCLHQLLEKKVLSQPDAVAISTINTKLSYSELNNKANIVARYLISKGITKGDFVGVLMKPSPEQIICLFAILKVGGAYVPMNTKDPYQRIVEIGKSAHLTLILTDTDLNDCKKEFDICFIEELKDVMHKGDSENLNLEIDITLPAYIIFTSGSTGKPKGVLVTHEKVANLIEWVNSTFNVDDKDVLIWSTNLCFDLSVYDIFGSLAAGACVRILSAEERVNPELQLQIMLTEKITFWDSAPQSMQQVASFFNKIADEDTSHLRLVFLSGDWIPLKLSDEIKSKFPNVKVVSLGGATEATIWSNFYVIEKIDPSWRSIPYGIPIQNARYYILDENLNHCDIKVKGDLYIGGNVLAREYYGDTELTNKKFVNDPYFPEHKMFKTGDKALWMSDGNIEFLGREDDQLKVRGFRVEIGEIKSAALQIDYIKDAVVISDKSDNFNTKIILFVTGYDNKNIDIKNVRAFLGKDLPEYMIPLYIFHIPQIPATGNGKVDSSKLFELYKELLTDFSILDDPNLTSTELKLAQIWIDVLKVSNFNVEDNFFDIGGNSILSTFITFKIETIFNIKFSLRDFFEGARINRLARLIDDKINAN